MFDEKSTPRIRRAATREVRRVHAGPAPDIEHGFTRDVAGVLERQVVAVEHGLAKGLVEPARDR